MVKHIGNTVSLGVKFVADGAASVFNSVAFCIDNASEERKAVPSFFPSNVADASRFDFFGCNDGDGRFALTGDPEATVRFCIERNKGGKVSFHWLVFLMGRAIMIRKKAKGIGMTASRGKI